ncbi:hypothetical protein AB838_06870 [Rhodobacteraceae bacterium (ex Bugula neritina AB1)]|nr:hypothetical protein AB838_06870 [Rhodobacteraceae bacterium (ex Bugula neritina AB1)]
MGRTRQALERNLFAYVEQLATGSEASGKGLAAFEMRSIGKIDKALAGLKDYVTLLSRSQAAYMKALSGLLNDEASYTTLDESLPLVKAAAERLRDS